MATDHHSRQSSEPGGADVAACGGQPARSCRANDDWIWRQAQIGHGSSVVIGCLVGWLLHPAGFVLAALVGLGIAASGISGVCGMRRFMARMPWNR